MRRRRVGSGQRHGAALLGALNPAVVVSNLTPNSEVYETMSKSIYHLACWKLVETASTAKGIPAKWRGRCAHCLSAIERGETITWPRTAKHPAAVSQVEYSASTAPSAADLFVASSDVEEDQPTPDPETPAPLAVDAFAAGFAAMVMPAVEQRIKCALASFDGASDAIVSRAVSQIKKELDFGAIVEAVVAAIPKPTRVEVVTSASHVPVDMGIQHVKFALFLKCLGAGQNVFIAGPSGSGKTTGAINAAKALNLKFFYTGAVGDPFGLFGYMTPDGALVRTAFRNAYEYGGVFLFDEVDGSDPNAVLAFNAALSNGHAAFPDGVIARHADFRCCAAANTFGQGATREYVGRNKLDEAFLQRFVPFEWGYDNDLELAMTANAEWAKRVQGIRARIEKRGLRVMITPRQTVQGAEMLACGISQDDVETMLFRNRMTDDQWMQVAS